jgi:hypothetical protein
MMARFALPDGTKKNGGYAKELSAVERIIENVLAVNSGKHSTK